MSLDRRELGTIGSDKSSSLSRSEAGTYDVINAEIQHAKRQELATGTSIAVNNNGPSVVGAGGTTDNEAEARRRVSFISFKALNKLS